MKKPGSVLLIIGGVLEIIGIFLSIIFIFACFGMSNPEFVAQVKESVQQAYPEYTAAQIDEAMAIILGYAKTVGIVLIVEAVLELGTGVLSFLTVKMQNKVCYIVLIVLSVLTGNIFILIGAIMGLTARE